MASKSAKKNDLSLTAYRGDAKTLLAFNLSNRKAATNLAGFTIQATPPKKSPYYIYNTLRFKEPGRHVQVGSEPANSSVNAPIHKFRWLHVPGQFHQGTDPAFGAYTYTVTPRFFGDGGSLTTLDPKLSVSVTIDVGPFDTGKLKLGFTRGFTQSQAFVHHFGLKALFRPKSKDLLFKTDQVSGRNPQGENYTFADEYNWLGFTARQRILEILDDVVHDKTLHLDVFAYDLSEPDVMSRLLQLAKAGRVRIILDNASLHKSTAKKQAPEDAFEKLFKKGAKKPEAILRGKFGRFSHDKVLIVSKSMAKANKPVRVLTGSTNFSVTGLYVNSNHVIVFEDPTVAKQYADVFEASWQLRASVKFNKSPLAAKPFSFGSNGIPQTEIAFSPHPPAVAKTVLDEIVTRIAQEEKKSRGSVLFAVMQMDKKSTGPVFPKLRKLHADEKIFSYGITDTTDGIALYKPGRKSGVLVTGKPTKTRLPPPFDQVPSIGLGHQVHHKFVVCGFNTDQAVVYCGSSNLALGGEKENGDNLIAIHDRDVAVAFAIEALGLVDHFDFLDRSAAPGAKGAARKPKTPSKSQEAETAGWFLSTDDHWVEPYFDPHDLHYVDRLLFGG